MYGAPPPPPVFIFLLEGTSATFSVENVVRCYRRRNNLDCISHTTSHHFSRKMILSRPDNMRNTDRAAFVRKRKRPVMYSQYRPHRPSNRVHTAFAQLTFYVTTSTAEIWWKALHTRWSSWMRHCATHRKVAGSIPDGVTGIFHWLNPSGLTMALGSTQPLTEMSTRKPSWG
jgi:hypothetical protein